MIKLSNLIIARTLIIMVTNIKSVITLESEVILKIQIFKTMMQGIIIFTLLETHSGKTLDYLHMPLNTNCLNGVIRTMSNIVISSNHALLNTNTDWAELYKDLDPNISECITSFVKTLSKSKLEYIKPIQIII